MQGSGGSISNASRVHSRRMPRLHRAAEGPPPLTVGATNILTLTVSRPPRNARRDRHTHDDTTHHYGQGFRCNDRVPGSRRADGVAGRRYLADCPGIHGASSTGTSRMHSTHTNRALSGARSRTSLREVRVRQERHLAHSLGARIRSVSGRVKSDIALTCRLRRSGTPRTRLRSGTSALSDLLARECGLSARVLATVVSRSEALIRARSLLANWSRVTKLAGPAHVVSHRAARVDGGAARSTSAKSGPERDNNVTPACCRPLLGPRTTRCVHRLGLVG